MIVLDWDYDESRPTELQDHTVEQFMARMQKTVPALWEVGYLVTYSSKGRVLKSDGKPAYSDPSGHVYLLTSNRNRIEVAGKLIEASCGCPGRAM